MEISTEQVRQAQKPSLHRPARLYKHFRSVPTSKLCIMFIATGCLKHTLHTGLHKQTNKFRATGHQGYKFCTVEPVCDQNLSSFMSPFLRLELLGGHFFLEGGVGHHWPTRRLDDCTKWCREENFPFWLASRLQITHRPTLFLS